jgi:hypothetical protein
MKSLISVMHQGLQVQMLGGKGPLIQKQLYLQMALVLSLVHQGVQPHQGVQLPELLHMVILIDKFIQNHNLIVFVSICSSIARFDHEGIF